MADATPEWLVEFVDQDGAHEFDHCDTLDDVQVRVRKLFDAGIREAYVYQLVPFTVQVDVTVKARRTRKQKASPAPVAPSGGPPPSGSEPPSAGENAQDGPGARKAGKLSCLGAGGDNAASTVGSGAETPLVPSFANLKPTGKEEESPKEGAERRPAPSPVCEASWPGDPACPGPAVLDVATGGWFCGFHLVQVPESFRYEMHRIHGARNRPVVRLAG